MSSDRLVNRLIALTVCLIGVALTAAYISSPVQSLREPLLLVIGALLTALRVGHGDEPVKVTDVTPYAPTEQPPTGD